MSDESWEIVAKSMERSGRLAARAARAQDPGHLNQEAGRGHGTMWVLGMVQIRSLRTSALARQVLEDYQSENFQRMGAISPPSQEVTRNNRGADVRSKR
jgi:hypothetical protein